MSKYICFDISNLLYRTFHAHTQENDMTIAGLATHVALMTLNKYFRQQKPDKVVMAFDRRSWRKDYTASDLCLSKKQYKGKRRVNMSPAQQAKYERFLGHLHEFETLVTNHTTIITLAAEMLEADDLIAGFVQAHPHDEVVIISSDNDMLQLLQYENVSIISPATDKPLTLEEYDNDADYFMFRKCIRGDDGDNVQAALPRVRETDIKKAYNDPFLKVQLLQKTWKDVSGKEFKVANLFEENELLMDLSKQPEYIRTKIEKTVEEAINKPRKFSHFNLMKFIGKYELDAIAKQLDTILPLLSK